jgi:hypothetical protein
MALLVFTTPDLFVAGAEASAQATSMSIEREAAELDATTYGSEGWGELRGGLQTTDLSVEGFADFAAGALSLDTQLAAALGGLTEFTVSPEAVVDGGLAFTFSGLLNSHNPISGDVGELAKLEFGMVSGRSPLVRGTVLSSPRTNRTVTGTGTSRQLGAVSATQRLWVGVHCLASTGGTITPRIESDDATGFPSATTRIAGSGITAPGSQWYSAVGPITDTWWRAAWTVTAGTHAILVTAGIQ